MRALGQHLRYLFQLFALRRQQLVAARIEIDSLQLLAAATEQAAERAERRADDLGQQGVDGLPDDRAVAELRIAHVAGNRQAEVDAPVAVLEYGDRQLQRQLERVGTVDSLAQGQLVHDDLVRAC